MRMRSLFQKTKYWVELISVSVIPFLLCFCAAPVEREIRHLVTQKIYERSGTSCIQVAYFYDAEVRSGLETTELTISNLRICITEEKLDMTNVLLEQSFTRTWHFSGSRPAPTWINRRIVDDLNVLPAARVFRTRHGELRCVVFDGQECNLYAAGESSHTFVHIKPDGEQEDLRHFYTAAFVVDDVYWSYALLRCGKWFGFRSVSFPRGADIALLHTEWCENVTTREGKMGQGRMTR